MLENKTVKDILSIPTSNMKMYLICLFFGASQEVLRKAGSPPSNTWQQRCSAAKALWCQGLPEPHQWCSQVTFILEWKVRVFLTRRNVYSFRKDGISIWRTCQCQAKLCLVEFYFRENECRHNAWQGWWETHLYSPKVPSSSFIGWISGSAWASSFSLTKKFKWYC